MLVGGFDFLEIIEIAGDFLRTLFKTVVGEHHVVGDQLARGHHAGLVRKHHALAQVDFEAKRVLLPFPFLGKFAADRIRRNPGVGVEWILAPESFRLGQVRDEELFVNLPGVVVVFPIPVG